MRNIFTLRKKKVATVTLRINKHIEIVGSSNPRLNAMAEDSQQTMLTVLGNIYSNVAITLVNDMDDLEKLVAKKPDLVVLGMKLVLLDPMLSYDDSPKVWLSEYLAEHGINFTGSTTTALVYEFDKHVAKQKVLDAGLQSSRYFISTIINPVFEHSLNYPLFVKPTNRGDSKGIDEKSVVHTEDELKNKILSIHKELSSDVLIEEYLPGREFSVAVMRRPNSVEMFAMPVELKAPADELGNVFLSESVKEADSEQVLAVDDSALKKVLNELAIGVFVALESRDYGRIDMRIDSQGMPSFIEANLMPGLSDHGYLSKCFMINESITYQDMILSIVALALERQTKS